MARTPLQLPRVATQARNPILNHPNADMDMHRRDQP